MKRFIFIIAMSIIAISSFAQNYVYAPSSQSREYYYLDRKISEQHNSTQDVSVIAGGLTRFGYAFNYDAFTYGVSLFYQWNHILGVTAGFDGYYIPNKYISRDVYMMDTVPSNLFAMPLWDIRAGLMFSKYVMIGAVMGKSNVDDYPNIISLKENAWFKEDKNNRMLYGAFVTFLLPISKHFGFNLDLAMTNKTGFNVGAGFNITVPVR